MLKILGGEARGRPLKSLSNAPHLRPILARVKKSMFDILTPVLTGSRFLDIYSGTGAVGLEALSRQAEFVGFIEKDRRCLQVLKQNLEMLGYSAKAHIFACDVLEASFSQMEPFDLIYMGPPYKDEDKNPLELVIPTLTRIKKFELLAHTGWVIAQHHKKENIRKDEFSWVPFRQQRYGDTMLSFYKHAQTH